MGGGGVKLKHPPPPRFFGFKFLLLHLIIKSFGTTVICSLTHLLTQDEVMIDKVIIIRNETSVLTTKVVKK